LYDVEMSWCQKANQTHKSIERETYVGLKHSPVADWIPSDINSDADFIELHRLAGHAACIISAMPP
jgi:hypothetical protein